MSIGILLTMAAKQGSGAQLRSLLERAAVASRTEPGNLLTVLMADPADDHKFSIFEVYRDEQAMQAHREAQHTIDSAPLIRPLFDGPPDIKRFDTIDWPQGFRVELDR